MNIIAPKQLIQTVQFGTKTKKRPTSIVRSFWFKTFVFAEVGALFLSYFVWNKMNTSQEYRYFIKNNVPVLLEGKIIYSIAFLKYKTNHFVTLKFSGFSLFYIKLEVE